MSGRRRQALAPSLFPFLAVLVCTLGTLILLLALVAQNATDAAEQSAAAKQAAENRSREQELATTRLTTAAVANMIQEEQFRVDRLVAVRDQQTADVEERRDQLTHLEDHISRLQDQLKQLSNEVELATGDTKTNVVDQTALADLKNEIERQQAALSELRADAKRQTPRVVIVPHKGPNGTARRPIYIECTANGVTVWPEGSQISILQLTDTFPGGNPLDGALRAIRYHVTQNYGDTSPPYPLLVVRPDGIESYAAARAAMRDWDDQFGYELVPAEVKLAFPRPDPQLKKRIDLAIREAAIRQHARHAIADRQGRSRKRLPTLSAASLDRQGRAGGFRSLRDPVSATADGRRSYPSYTNSGTGFSDPNATQSITPSGGSSPALRELDEHLREAAAEIRKEESQRTGGTSDDVPNASIDPSSLADGTNAAQSASGSGLANSTTQRTVDGSIRSGSPGLGFDRQAAKLTPGQPFTQLPENRFAANGPASHTMGSSPALPQSSAAGIPESSDSASQPPSPATAPTPEMPLSPQMASPQVSAGQTLPATGQPGTDGGDSRRGSGQPAAQEVAQLDATGQARQAAPLGAMNRAPNLSNQQSSSAETQSGSQPPSGRPLVQRRGRDWALPESMAGAHGTKVVRTIRVQCYPDRFVLLPPTGGGAVELFGFSDGQVDRATLELATAVRDRVQQWGAALPGGRWQPRLDVEVMPRGEARFHQLRTLMQGSGVDVQGRTTQ